MRLARAAYAAFARSFRNPVADAALPLALLLAAVPPVCLVIAMVTA